MPVVIEARERTAGRLWEGIPFGVTLILGSCKGKVLVFGRTLVQGQCKTIIIVDPKVPGPKGRIERVAVHRESTYNLP